MVEQVVSGFGSVSCDGPTVTLSLKDGSTIILSDSQAYDLAAAMLEAARVAHAEVEQKMSGMGFVDDQRTMNTSGSGYANGPTNISGAGYVNQRGNISGQGYVDGREPPHLPSAKNTGLDQLISETDRKRGGGKEPK
jgi:hypothetical protein